MCTLVIGLRCSDRCIEYRLAEENVLASFVKAHLQDSVYNESFSGRGKCVR